MPHLCCNFALPVGDLAALDFPCALDIFVTSLFVSLTFHRSGTLRVQPSPLFPSSLRFGPFALSRAADRLSRRPLSTSPWGCSSLKISSLNITTFMNAPSAKCFVTLFFELFPPSDIRWRPESMPSAGPPKIPNLHKLRSISAFTFPHPDSLVARRSPAHSGQKTVTHCVIHF